jgi:hypothetical protein
LNSHHGSFYIPNGRVSTKYPYGPKSQNTAKTYEVVRKEVGGFMEIPPRDKTSPSPI